jgi:hypothetical protein
MQSGLSKTAVFISFSVVARNTSKKAGQCSTFVVGTYMTFIRMQVIHK